MAKKDKKEKEETREKEDTVEEEKPAPVKSAGGIFNFGRIGEFYAEEITKNRFAIYFPEENLVRVEPTFFATNEEEKISFTSQQVSRVYGKFRRAGFQPMLTLLSSFP